MLEMLPRVFLLFIFKIIYLLLHFFLTLSDLPGLRRPRPGAGGDGQGHHLLLDGSVFEDACYLSGFEIPPQTVSHVVCHLYQYAEAFHPDS